MAEGNGNPEDNATVLRVVYARSDDGECRKHTTTDIRESIRSDAFLASGEMHMS
jgi:hypothetical protein